MVSGNSFPLHRLVQFPMWHLIYFFQVLCKSHPAEFASYFHYCQSLTFDQRPDYGFLKRLFRDLFSREGSLLLQFIMSYCSLHSITFQMNIINIKKVFHFNVCGGI